MKTPRLLIWALTLALSATVACQKSDQSAVQPEKLASSSASGETGGGGGPFVPFANGHGPGELKDKDAAPSASAPADSAKADGSKPAPEPTAGDDDDDDDDDDDEAVTPPPSAVASEIKLVKAGAEPRQALRFKPKVGQKHTFELVMTTAVSMEVDGQPQPAGKVPPMVITMGTEVLEAKEGGDIRYRFDVKDAGVRSTEGVQAKVVAALNQALGALVGLSGNMLVTDRGITKDTKISVPGDKGAEAVQVLEGMKQAMQQLGAPLPEEAVGQGARWTQSTTLTQNGMTVSQLATYDLVKIDGNKITCKVTLEQSAPKQKVKSPIGVTVDLLSLSSKGGGTTRMRLDRLTPIKSTLKVQTKASMRLPKGQTMKMDTRLTVEMGKPKKKAEPTAEQGTEPAPAPAPAPPPPPAP